MVLGEDLTHVGDTLAVDPAILADNCLLLGAHGSGKTTLGRVLLQGSLAAGIPGLFIDTTGDLTGWLMRDLGLPLGRGLPIHPPEGQIQLRSLDVDVAAGIFLEPRPLTSEEDEEELRDLVAAFLGVLGFRARERAPEFLLIETIVHQRWQAGAGVRLEDLATLVIRPPLTRLGVFALDRVISASRREDLSGAIHGLLESPGFADLEAPEALSLDLLLGREGGPPLGTVLTFAERTPSIRRFIVSLLMAKLKRREGFPAGSGLKLLLYFDEAADFIPRGERTLTTRPLHEALLGWSNPDVGVVLVAESHEDLHADVDELCETWLVGRMPVLRTRRAIVEALDLVDPPVDEVALERQLRDLGAGQFVLRTPRLSELGLFRIQP